MKEKNKFGGPRRFETGEFKRAARVPERAPPRQSRGRVKVAVLIALLTALLVLTLLYFARFY